MKYQYRKAPNPMQYSRNEGEVSEVRDFKAQERDVPCQAACPAKTDVPKYIEQIALGNFDAAYQINLEDNVFPAALGRICARPCEDACRHNWTNTHGAVRICHLKRTSSDNRVEKAEPLAPWYKPTGKKVAVIGGGPAGLAAARELTRYGHKVTIYEKENHLGGMLIDGIPRFRLPLAEVESEIDLIIRSGVDVKLGQNVDAQALEKLTTEFDSVLISVGTTKAKGLGIDGEFVTGAIPGLQFMADYNQGRVTKLEGDVVVIGGGFTAVDCARSCARAARRLLGEGGKVTIGYRRTEHHMAAELEEIEEIRLENIDIRTLVSPVGIEVKDGKVVGVKFVRNRIVEASGSKKGGIEEIKGSEYVEPCSTLIVAIGQDQDYSILPKGVSFARDTQTSTNPKIFGAGDFVLGSLDVIHAVADGKAVADTIDRFLTGKIRRKEHVAVQIVDINREGKTGRVRSHDQQEAAPMPLLQLAKRARADAEVELGWGELAITQNATRCYLCNNRFEIDADKCIHCDWCIDVAPRDCIKKITRVLPDKDGFIEDYVTTEANDKATFIYIDADECIGCGKCLRVCPTEAISMKRTERVHTLEDSSQIVEIRKLQKRA